MAAIQGFLGLSLLGTILFLGLSLTACFSELYLQGVSLMFIPQSVLSNVSFRGLFTGVSGVLSVSPVADEKLRALMLLATLDNSGVFLKTQSSSFPNLIARTGLIWFTGFTPYVLTLTVSGDFKTLTSGDFRALPHSWSLGDLSGEL